MKEDGNYEVLHSCENRGCFETSHYVQRHDVCHDTQRIKIYHQLGRDLNLIKSLARATTCTTSYKGHAKYLDVQLFIWD